MNRSRSGIAHRCQGRWQMRRTIAVVFGVVAALAGVSWLVISRVADQHVIRLADVPRVFEQLSRNGSDGSFAVFMFSDHRKGRGA